MSVKGNLKEVIISLTTRCNYRCQMCQIPEQPVPELSTQEVKKLIGEVSLLHPRNIVFSGGEPLLRKDIFELSLFAHRLGFITCLTSNGSLIDQATARRLKDSGVNVVNISIEGPEEIHDELRGSGSWSKALEAVRHLVASGIEVTVASMVCRKNYRYMADLVAVAKDLGASTIKFQAFNDIFLMDQSRVPDFMPEISELNGIHKSSRMALEAAQRLGVSTNPGSYLEKLAFYLCGAHEHLDFQRGCSALWTSCPVDSQGNVYPCWIFNRSAVGNVKKESILRIWNSRRHRAMRARIEKTGCPVCFMSCYDERLNSSSDKLTVLERWRLINKSGIGYALKFRLLGLCRAILKPIVRSCQKQKQCPENNFSVFLEITRAKAKLEARMRERR